MNQAVSREGTTVGAIASIRKNVMASLATPFLSFLLLTVAVAGAQKPQSSWFKGNTHTLNSDGDSTPDDVVKWYQQHGYD
jgi:hypothetical protein